jgi:hypothetical protein
MMFLRRLGMGRCRWATIGRFLTSWIRIGNCRAVPAASVSPRLQTYAKYVKFVLLFVAQSKKPADGAVASAGRIRQAASPLDMGSIAHFDAARIPALDSRGVAKVSSLPQTRLCVCA